MYKRQVPKLTAPGPLTTVQAIVGDSPCGRLLSVTVPLSCSAFGISTMEFPVMAMLMTPPDPPEVGGVTGQGPLITFEMTTFRLTESTATMFKVPEFSGLNSKSAFPTVSVAPPVDSVWAPVT